MHVNAPTAYPPELQERRSVFVFLSFLIVFFASSFFMNEFDSEFSTYENYAANSDDQENKVAEGNTTRKIVYGAIGVVGLVLLALPSRQRINFKNLPCALVCSYVVFCMASFLWADNSAQTSRRLGVAVFGLLAIFGAAKHLAIKDIINAALGVGTVLLLLSVFVELRLGTFTPWASHYRFAGFVHPNTQGGICGLVAIAAFFGTMASQRGKLIYFGLFLLAATFLLLTKSRTSIAACFFAISTAWFLFASVKYRTLVGLGLLAAGCAGFMAWSLFGTELSDGAAMAVRVDKQATSELVSLNGRVPLWISLLDDVQERPLLGYGFQAFWTPDRIYAVSSDQEWTVASAHSVPLEVVLSTGLIGGLLFGMAVVATFRRTIGQCRRAPNPQNRFVLSGLLYALIGSLFESGFSQPNGFEPFLIGVALIHLISISDQAKNAEVADTRDAHSVSTFQTVSTGGLT